jgi:hypothetical protein
VDFKPNDELVLVRRTRTGRTVDESTTINLEDVQDIFASQGAGGLAQQLLLMFETMGRFNLPDQTRATPAHPS